MTQRDPKWEKVEASIGPVKPLEGVDDPELLEVYKGMVAFEIAVPFRGSICSSRILMTENDIREFESDDTYRMILDEMVWRIDLALGKYDAE